MAIETACNEPDCDFPDCECWETKRRYSQSRIPKLENALLLAKEMMISNDLHLKHTFEVIDDALKY